MRATKAEMAVKTALVLAPLAFLIGLALVWLPSRRTVAEVPLRFAKGRFGRCLSWRWPFQSLPLWGWESPSNHGRFCPSVLRLPSSGERVVTFTVPATTEEILEDDSRDPDQHPVEVDIQSTELFALGLFSSQSITVGVDPDATVDTSPLFEASPGNDFIWVRRMDSAPLFRESVQKTIYVRNYGLADADVELKLTVRPKHPQALLVVITAMAVVSVFLLYILQRSALPKMSAIALATVKSEMAQPLFLIVMLLGLFLLLAFIWIPYNTFGEDIKVLKDSSMVLIKVLCIILAVWAASTSISDEIEAAPP